MIGSGTAALLGLNGGFEALEPVRPQLRQELFEGLEALGSDCVEPALSFGTDLDQSGVFQDVKMLRDSLLGNLEVRRDVVDRPRLVGDEYEHCSASGFGQGAQHGFGGHLDIISRCDLYNVALVCIVMVTRQQGEIGAHRHRGQRGSTGCPRLSPRLDHGGVRPGSVAAFAVSSGRGSD